MRVDFSIGSRSDDREGVLRRDVNAVLLGLDRACGLPPIALSAEVFADEYALLVRAVLSQNDRIGGQRGKEADDSRDSVAATMTNVHCD